jgi:hypothetical protein
VECEKFMQIFLELDNGEALPEGAAAHLETCARCAAEARGLEELMSSPRVWGNLAPGESLVSGVMARIVKGQAAWAAGKEFFSENRRELSLRNWVGTGLFILLGMFLIPFSTILPELNRIIPGLRIALPLVLGLVITLYGALFIGSHLNVFRRLLGASPPPASPFVE